MSRENNTVLCAWLISHPHRRSLTGTGMDYFRVSWTVWDILDWFQLNDVMNLTYLVSSPELAFRSTKYVNFSGYSFVRSLATARPTTPISTERSAITFITYWGLLWGESFGLTSADYEIINNVFWILNCIHILRRICEKFCSFAWMRIFIETLYL